MHTGESQTPGGRAGEGTTAGISRSLQRLGFRIERFKTGTPAAVERSHDRLLHGRNVSPGDDSRSPFSFLTDSLGAGATAVLDHLHERRKSMT